MAIRLRNIIKAILILHRLLQLSVSEIAGNQLADTGRRALFVGDIGILDIATNDGPPIRIVFNPIFVEISRYKLKQGLILNVAQIQLLDNVARTGAAIRSYLCTSLPRDRVPRRVIRNAT